MGDAYSAGVCRGGGHHGVGSGEDRWTRERVSDLPRLHQHTETPGQRHQSRQGERLQGTKRKYGWIYFCLYIIFQLFFSLTQNNLNRWQVDKIIDQLQQFVQSFDLFGLKEYWLYLDRRLFSRLEDVYRTTVNKLRTSLYRYYVINTIQVKFSFESKHTSLSASETRELHFKATAFIHPEGEPGEDAGVFPETGTWAAGPGRMAGLVHPAFYPHPRAEPRLLDILLPPVGRHFPGFTAQLPVCPLPVYAYPSAWPQLWWGGFTVPFPVHAVMLSFWIYQLLAFNWFSPQPVLLSFDAEVQKTTSLTEENEQLRQLVREKHKSLIC